MEGNSWKRVDPTLVPKGMRLSSGEVKSCIIDGRQFEVMIICHPDRLGVGYTELLGRPVINPAATPPAG